MKTDSIKTVSIYKKKNERHAAYIFDCSEAIAKSISDQYADSAAEVIIIENVPLSKHAVGKLMIAKETIDHVEII